MTDERFGPARIAKELGEWLFVSLMGDQIRGHDALTVVEAYSCLAQEAAPFDPYWEPTANLHERILYQLCANLKASWEAGDIAQIREFATAIGLLGLVPSMRLQPNPRLRETT